LSLGKTLGEIDAMPQRELHGWREFFVLYPFDDHHRFHRPAALLAAVFGGNYDNSIAFLSPRPNRVNEADARTLAAFGIKTQ
jgi:hypothetical protein